MQGVFLLEFYSFCLLFLLKVCNLSFALGFFVAFLETFLAIDVLLVFGVVLVVWLEVRHLICCLVALFKVCLFA